MTIYIYTDIQKQRLSVKKKEIIINNEKNYGDNNFIHSS